MFDDDDSSFIKPMVGPAYRNLDGSWQKSWIQKAEEASLASFTSAQEAASSAIDTPATTPVGSSYQDHGSIASNRPGKPVDAATIASIRSRLADKEKSKQDQFRAHWPSLRICVFHRLDAELQALGYVALPRQWQVVEMCTTAWLWRFFPGWTPGDSPSREQIRKLALDLVDRRNQHGAMWLLAFPLSRKPLSFRLAVMFGLKRRPRSTEELHGREALASGLAALPFEGRPDPHRGF